MISTAIALLERDRLQHIDMINLLRHAGDVDRLEVICADRRGVVISMEGSVRMTALFDRNAAPELLDLLGQPELITTHQEWSESLVEERFGPIKDNTRCIQFVRESTSPLAYDTNAIDIRPMTKEYIPLAASHYHMGSAEYLTGRMEKGALFGGFLDSEMVGFIGLHSEEAIGMLEILPAHRRRGYAVILESFMVNHQLRRGYVPYCHVVLGNQPSVNLQRSLGFVPAPQPVSWISTRFSPDI